MILGQRVLWRHIREVCRRICKWYARWTRLCLQFWWFIKVYWIMETRSTSWNWHRILWFIQCKEKIFWITKYTHISHIFTKLQKWLIFISLLMMCINIRANKLYIIQLHKIFDIFRLNISRFPFLFYLAQLIRMVL